MLTQTLTTEESKHYRMSTQTLTTEESKHKSARNYDFKRFSPFTGYHKSYS